MFNVSYDYAKLEVARRHEKLVEAQRSGAAYEYRPRPRRRHLLVKWSRQRSPEQAPVPAPATSEPCITC